MKPAFYQEDSNGIPHKVKPDKADPSKTLFVADRCPRRFKFDQKKREFVEIKTKRKAVKVNPNWRTAPFVEMKES